jgi:hypothetical protein
MAFTREIARIRKKSSSNHQFIIQIRPADFKMDCAAAAGNHALNARIQNAFEKGGAPAKLGGCKSPGSAMADTI